MILLDGEIEVIMMEYDGGSRARVLLHEDTEIEWWVDVSRLSFPDESESSESVTIEEIQQQLSQIKAIMRFMLLDMEARAKYEGAHEFASEIRCCLDLLERIA